MKTIGIDQAGPIREDASKSQWIKSSRVEYSIIKVPQIIGSWEEREIFCNVIIANLT